MDLIELLILGLVFFAVSGAGKKKKKKNQQSGPASRNPAGAERAAGQPRGRAAMVEEQRRRAEAYRAQQAREADGREHPDSSRQSEAREHPYSRTAEDGGKRMSEAQRQRLQELRERQQERRESQAAAYGGPVRPHVAPSATTVQPHVAPSATTVQPHVAPSATTVQPHVAPLHVAAAPMRRQESEPLCLHPLHFHRAALVNGILMAEILGPCKARRHDPTNYNRLR